jgi:hypothetical protein
MALDSDRIQFQERVEARQKEGLERLLAIMRRCDEEAEARRREWEQAKGREMTRAEKIDAHHDEFLIKMTITTQAQVTEIERLTEEMRRGFAQDRAEFKAEAQAGREALFRMLDRLPPRDGE